MEPLTIYLLITSLVAVAIWWLFTNRSKMPDMPAPKGYPIVGNLFQVDERLEMSLAKWTKEVGGFFKINMFQKEIVVVNSYDAIYEVLVKKGNDFAGRPVRKNFRSEYCANARGLAFSNPTEAWQILRKVCHREIKMYDTGLKTLESMNLEIVGELVNHFRSYNSKSFDPKINIQNAFMGTMALLAVGRKYPIDHPVFKLYMEVEKGSENAISPVGALILNTFPFLRFFGNKTFKEMKHFVETRKELYKTLKADALKQREEMSANNNRGILCALLQHLENAKNTTKDDDSMFKEIDIEIGTIGTMLAGTITSTRSTYFFLNIMHQYSEVQTKLQQEVDTVVGPHRPVSASDKPNMPYTMAVVYELLRYTSVAALSIPHTTLRNTTIQGKFVPAGREVLTNLWALHHDEDFWEEPFVFKPERFLEADGTLVSPSHPNRRHILPFGAGPRVCLGEVLALGRLFLVFATIAQVFTVKPGDVKLDCDPRLFKPGFVLDSKPFDVCLISRNDELFN